MKFNISMPLDFYNKMKSMADKRQMSISQYIRFCIFEYWEANGI